MKVVVKHKVINRCNECDILSTRCNEDLQIVNDPFYKVTLKMTLL